VGAWVRGCVGAWVRGCVGAWVRGCVGAWVRGWVGGRERGWVRAWVGAWVRGWVGGWGGLGGLQGVDSTVCFSPCLSLVSPTNTHPAAAYATEEVRGRIAIWRKATVSGTPPAPRSGHSFTAVSGRRVVVFGGCGAGSPATSLLNDLHVLDVGVCVCAAACAVCASACATCASACVSCAVWCVLRGAACAPCVCTCNTRMRRKAGCAPGACLVEGVWRCSAFAAAMFSFPRAPPFPVSAPMHPCLRMPLRETLTPTVSPAPTFPSAPPQSPVCSSARLYPSLTSSLRPPPSFPLSAQSA
jgi:hypothetical protein